MESKMIDKKLIKLDMEADDIKDFFQKMCKELQMLGYVKKSFLEAITKREQTYPTALPTQPYAVAIPHADPEHVNKPFVAAIRLKNPIKWCEMATNDVWHDVKFIFILGFKKEEGHVELLQLLVESIQNKNFMNQLLLSQSVEEYQKAIFSMKGF